MQATQALLILALPVGATAVAALARRLGLPAPLLLVVAGLLVSFVPGLPSYTLDPALILYVFLPPLLYAAAWQSSYLSLKDNRRQIGLLSVGLVLFTTFAVGYVAHLVVPGLPLSAAFVLGAIIAPPDAVAAVSIARRLGLPRRTVTILVGESLFNDATALTVFKVAVAAAVGGGFSLFSGMGQFVAASIGGVAVGVALGPPSHWLRVRLRDPVVENSVALMVPFVAYLVAEAFHVSGVIAVVVAGIYLGHRSTEAHFASRLQGLALWGVIEFVLESLVFALIGLQLPSILRQLSGRSWPALVWYALVIFAVVVVTRFVWVFPAVYLPCRLSRKVRETESVPSWGRVTVLASAGMRGVVSLAAAFAIPIVTHKGQPFPDRDLLLFLTFVVVLGTLLVQGLSFPWVARRLGVESQGEVFADNLAEAAAQQAAANAALARLERLAAEDEADYDHIVDRLRALAEQRQLGAWERLGGGTGPQGEETPSTTYRRLRREMLVAEREVFIRMRDERRIDDEVLRRVMYELDLEEAMLARD